MRVCVRVCVRVACVCIECACHGCVGRCVPWVIDTAGSVSVSESACEMYACLCGVSTCVCYLCCLRGVFHVCVLLRVYEFASGFTCSMKDYGFCISGECHLHACVKLRPCRSACIPEIFCFAKFERLGERETENSKHRSMTPYP